MSRIKALQLVGTATTFLRRIDSLTNVKISPHFNYIAALNTESDLSVIRLVHEERSCSALTISDVDSFNWHNCENDDTSCSLAVLTSDGSIHIHDVLSESSAQQLVLQSNIIANIPRETINGFLQNEGIGFDDGITNVRLLHYENWAVSLLINGNLVCIFIVGKQHAILLSATIHLQDVSDCRLIAVAGDFVFHFCVRNAIIYTYRLDGSFCTAIDVHQLVAKDIPNLCLDVGPLARLAVSPAADFLVVVDQQFVSVCICLRQLLPSAVCSRPSLMCTELDNVSMVKINTLSSVGTPSIDSLTSKCSHRSMALIEKSDALNSSLSWLQSLKKNRKCLTGFRSSQTTARIDHRSASTCHRITTPGLQNVHDLEASNSTVAFWERSENVGESSQYYGSLIVCNVRDVSLVASLKFSEPTYVVLRSAVNLPYLILTAKSVDAVSVNVRQEDVISKFMFYENAAVADLLAKLNGWECIAMPLNVLELALRNHQIDAVVFFLKSQEDVSCDCNTVDVDGNITTKRNAVMAIASLLTTTVKENMVELGSKNFAEQLLQISLAHFNKILQNALSVKCNFSNDDCTASTVAWSTVTHLVDLRKYLKNLPVTSTPHGWSSFSSTDLLLNQLKTEVPSLHTCWTDWRHMKEQEIIYNAIWNRCIPLAEVFCATELTEKSTESVNFYGKCLTLGLDAVVDCLERKDVKRAIKQLSNMGCGVWDKLLKICFNTANKDLRKFLVEELTRREILTHSESKTVAFLEFVEQIYSCQSFERALESLIESRSWNDEELKKMDHLFKLPPLVELSNKLQLAVGTVGFNNVDNWQSTDYCCLTLEWTKCWSSEVWERIITDGTQSNEDTQYQELVSAEVYFQYLLSRNDLPKLLAWMIRPAENHQQLRNITPQMVEAIPLFASPFVTNLVFDELAKYGIFCSEEKTDVQSLLLRLVRINANVSAVNIFSSKSTSLSALEFQEKIIRFCLQHDLPLLLYENMERFGSLWNELLLENLDFKDCNTLSWLPMMVHFRNWIQNPKDQEAVFKASLSNAEFQLKLQQPTVNEILKAGSLVVGMATVLCVPGSLRMALLPPENVNEIEWKVDIDILKSVLCNESTLASSISQFVFEQQDPLYKQDVTVYGLLRDNVPFDVSHLFGWQTSNTYKTSDCFPDLPYFSHPELANKYGHIEDLDFTYYLKQGRPSFAYAKFVSVQILCNRQNNTISNMEIADACNVCHSLALQFFYKQEIAAACVAFMEMLSWNTRGLRIDLQVALEILAHQNDSFVIASSASPSTKRQGINRMNDDKIAELVMNGVTGGKLAFADVLNYLEKAILSKCTFEGFSDSSMEEFLMWSLVALFCRRHNSPLSTTYLKLCAQRNDWMMFALYAEVYAIPKYQVMQMIQHYPTNQMTQHLKNAFTQLRFHAMRRVSGQTYRVVGKKIPARDLRANLYARIGVSSFTLKEQNDQGSDVKSDGKASDDDTCSQPESVAGSSDDLTDHSAISSLTSGGIAQSFSVEDVPSDLLSVLLYCNQHPNPWKLLLACAVHLRNPVLSVMAACYNEASILDCLCVWLYTSCHCAAFEQLVSSKFDQITCQPLSLDDLKGLIIAAMKLRQILLLAEGFYYFQPESPLYDLFRFLKLCIHDKVYEAGSVVLREFQNSMSKITEINRQIVGSLVWFQETVVAVINETILLTSTPRECIQFLDMLNSDHFLKSLIDSAVRVPNYMQLFDILRLLVDTNVDVDLRIFLLPSDSEVRGEECNLVLHRLLSNKQFEISYKFVQITGLPRSSVVLAQLREELSVQYDFLAEGNLQARLAIWNHCSIVFKDNYVPYEFIADFFTEYGLKIKHPLERFYVLHLAWAEITAGYRSGEVTAERPSLEREMWLARIAASVRNVSVGASAEEAIVGWDAFSVKVPSPAAVKLKSSKEIFFTAQENIVQEPYRLQSDAEKLALDKIICQELDNGHIDTAYRISQLFDHKCISLNIVLTCLKLAEGAMALHHLEVDMRILLEKGSMLRPRKLSSRKISVSSSRNSLNTGSISETPSPQAVPPNTAWSAATLLNVPATVNIKQNDDVLEVMGKLVDHCEYGVQCCTRIIVCYNIANALGLQYLDIVLHFDDGTLLKVLLQSDLEDRFFLAKEYILSTDVDDTFVASFLCEHIFNALRLYMGQSNEDEELKSVRELILKPSDSSAAFMQLAKLCKDPSLLGSLLLGLTDVRRKDHVQLSLDVELCIRAHSCFTVACHVEGITRSLHKAKKLCKMLTEATEFSLMVRLLTGIGRFSEMTYVFDILRENHQFELLFRKGMEKVPDLKMALLDYVRRFHPVDIETFTMISLHFSMYREIACMLLSDANSQMNGLDFKNRKEKAVLQESLENIMQLLADAAESYSKADCMQQSINCNKQAELVALQLYLLNSDVQVMCLGSSQVSEFIVSHNKFYESLIIADAYSRHKDWAQALYNNFVVKNDAGYLRDLQETMSISSSLLEEVSRRYQMSLEKNSKMMANVKYLLSLLDEIQPRYYLAIDLGFDDVVAELLQGDGGSFLKDVMQNRQQW